MCQLNDTVFLAAFGGGAAAGIFTFVAVIGAEWFRWYIDRPLIRVEVDLGRIYFGDLEDQPQQIFLEATNPHSRAVTVSSFGLIYSKRKFRWLRFPSVSTRLWWSPNGGYRFPMKIEGGESLTQWHSWVDHFETLKKQGLEPRQMA